MKLTYKIIMGAAALSLAAAGVVYAQQGNTMGNTMGMGQAMGMNMGQGMAAGPMAGGMMAGADGGAMAATRLADLKTELQITPAQEAAWLSFENQAKQQAAAMQTMRSQMQAQMHNPQPGAAGIDFAAQRDAMIKLHDGNQAAVKDLYAALTPQQKAIADQRLNAMGGNRGGCNHLAS